jgi:hypothetical protein
MLSPWWTQDVSMCGQIGLNIGGGGALGGGCREKWAKTVAGMNPDDLLHERSEAVQGCSE